MSQQSRYEKYVAFCQLLGVPALSLDRWNYITERLVSDLGQVSSNPLNAEDLRTA